MSTISGDRFSADDDQPRKGTSNTNGEVVAAQQSDVSLAFPPLTLAVVEPVDDDNKPSSSCEATVATASDLVDDASLSSKEDEASIPSVAARPIFSASVIGATFSDNDDSAQTPQRQRAQHINVTVCRERSTNDELGISLLEEDDDGPLRIAGISPGGLLHDSPLRTGDQLLSINGRSCKSRSIKEVLLLLEQDTTGGFLTIVARNPTGDPSLVETMVQRPAPGAPLGITVAHYSEQGSLLVSKIVPSGVFAHSLINVKDRVLSINGVGCVRLESNAAADIMRSIPKNVVLVTQVQTRAGLVLISEPAEATSENNAHHDDFPEAKVVGAKRRKRVSPIERRRRRLTAREVFTRLFQSREHHR